MTKVVLIRIFSPTLSPPFFSSLCSCSPFVNNNGNNYWSSRLQWDGEKRKEVEGKKELCKCDIYRSKLWSLFQKKTGLSIIQSTWWQIQAKKKCSWKTSIQILCLEASTAMRLRSWWWFPMLTSSHLCFCLGCKNYWNQRCVHLR